jgi:hypothetical protein
MARCFCGCGRRVLIRGRVANIYGGNADTLVKNLCALEEEPDAFPVPLPEDLPQVIGNLEELRYLYRCGVHREGVPGGARVEYDDWVHWRNRALEILAPVHEAIASDPEAMRTAALGTTLGPWFEEQEKKGVSTDEAAKLLLKSPEEIDRILGQ